MHGHGHASLPYDCHAGMANWRTGWSPGKKAWCSRDLRDAEPRDSHCRAGAAPTSTPAAKFKAEPPEVPEELWQAPRTELRIARGLKQLSRSGSLSILGRRKFLSHRGMNFGTEWMREHMLICISPRCSPLASSCVECRDIHPPGHPWSSLGLRRQRRRPPRRPPRWWLLQREPGPSCGEVRSSVCRVCSDHAHPPSAAGSGMMWSWSTAGGRHTTDRRPSAVVPSLRIARRRRTLGASRHARAPALRLLGTSPQNCEALVCERSRLAPHRGWRRQLASGLVPSQAGAWGCACAGAPVGLSDDQVATLAAAGLVLQPLRQLLRLRGCQGPAPRTEKVSVLKLAHVKAEWLSPFPQQFTAWRPCRRPFLPIPSHVQRHMFEECRVKYHVPVNTTSSACGTLLCCTLQCITGDIWKKGERELGTYALHNS